MDRVDRAEGFSPHVCALIVNGARDRGQPPLYVPSVLNPQERSPGGSFQERSLKVPQIHANR
jgi:hypothetical protein